MPIVLVPWVAKMQLQLASYHCCNFSHHFTIYLIRINASITDKTGVPVDMILTYKITNCMVFCCADRQADTG